MRVESPVFADLPAQPQRLSVGGEEKLNGCCIKTNTMVQRLNLVHLVDAANDHHSNEDLEIVDVPRVTCEERLHNEWFVRLNHNVDPGCRDIYPRKLIDDLVDLHDHDRIVKGGRLNDDRSIFGVRPRKEI